MRVVWLASYPKSGNTWVRFLLHDLLFGPAQVSIDIAQKIPDIHRRLPFDPPGPGRPLYAKSHYLFSDRHPHAARTDRAVHIVRHPKDVLLSALNYRRMTGTSAQELTDRAYCEAFCRAGGDPGWIEQHIGTWASHAASWQNAPFPVLRVRYEDLRADTPAALRAVADFLSIEADAARLAEASRRCSFEALRAMEAREKRDAPEDPSGTRRLFVGDANAAAAGRMFMNAGRSGQSLASIAPDLDAAFDAAFAEAMARFGYGS